MTKSVLITQERKTICVTIKTILPQVWFLHLLFFNPSGPAFYQLGASVLSPGTGHDQWRRYKQETELVSGFVFTLPGRDETISVSDTSQNTSTHKILNIYHVSSFIYLLDTPTPPHLSALLLESSHTPPRHSRGYDYETHLLSPMTWVSQNREILLFVDVQKKDFPFLLHFLFNDALFSFCRWTMAHVWNMNMNQWKTFWS